MKKSVLLFMTVFGILMTYANLPLNPAGLNWEQVYKFDKSNVFAMELYAKNNELMTTINYKTYYQSAGENFDVKMVTDGHSNGSETVIDKNNQVAIQIMGLGTASPLYNAGGFKYPNAEDLKKLDLVPTGESKLILGYMSYKYTYTYKKIFGIVWLSERCVLPNDFGVFRACKMAAIHNTLSQPGFVMEMTTEDSGGGKTIMKTVSLQNDEKYSIDLKGVQMTKAMNKINYYTF